MQTTEPILATCIRPTADALIIILGDREVSVAWDKCSPRLAAATDVQRQCAELSPGGYGVHWPLLDEDLSVTGLVRKA
jgi:hypothetical protein